MKRRVWPLQKGTEKEGGQGVASHLSGHPLSLFSEGCVCIILEISQLNPLQILKEIAAREKRMKNGEF